MKSFSSASIGAGGVLRSLASGPPLTIRRVHSPERALCRLCLINSAAGPLSGDEVELAIEVADDARAELVSAGAAIAQGSGGSAARVRTCVSLGERSDLFAEPAPLIVCAGAEVAVEIELCLAATAQVHWRELLVLGRAGEEGGLVSLRWNVTRAGVPVLRQHLDLRNSERRRWPGMLAGCRVMASALVSGPTVQASGLVADSTAVRQRIDAHTMLATVLDRDAASATARLDALLSGQGRSSPQRDEPWTRDGRQIESAVADFQR